MNTTSPSLLQRLRQPGEQCAWERFTELYTPLLYYWARRQGLQQQDAADLVQEVLALLVRKLPAFHYDHQGSFRSWLRTVTLNKLRDLHRSRCARPMSDTDTALANLAEPGVGDVLEETEYRQHLVRRALQVMESDFEPTTWKACWALVVEGRSAAEVAGDLRVSVGAIYVAKSRVLTRLRGELHGLLE